MFYPIVIFANISANNISQKAEYILAVATCFITTNYKTYLLIWLINRQPPGTQFQSDTTSLVQFLLVLSVPLLLCHFFAFPSSRSSSNRGINFCCSIGRVASRAGGWGVCPALEGGDEEPEEVVEAGGAADAAQEPVQRL